MKKFENGSSIHSKFSSPDIGSVFSQGKRLLINSISRDKENIASVISVIGDELNKTIREIFITDD